MSAIVRARGLTKFYGNCRGVVDLDFTLDGGGGRCLPVVARPARAPARRRPGRARPRGAASDPLRHGLSPGNAAVLAALTLVAAVVAVAAFDKRDLRA